MRDRTERRIRLRWPAWGGLAGVAAMAIFFLCLVLNLQGEIDQQEADSRCSVFPTQQAEQDMRVPELGVLSNNNDTCVFMDHSWPVLTVSWQKDEKELAYDADVRAVSADSVTVPGAQLAMLLPKENGLIFYKHGTDVVVGMPNGTQADLVKIATDVAARF